MGERLDEIIRVKKRPSNFVMMDKTFLEDNRLSFKAKGILAYLLSKPDNWKVITKNLVNASSDGEYSVYSGLKELKKYGYFEKIPIRNEQGTRIVRWESVIYEVPKSLLLENCELEKQEEKSLLLGNQDIENLHVENLYQENCGRNNNNINNNYSYLSSSISYHAANDFDSATDIIKMIEKQIEYNSLAEEYPQDLGMINMILELTAKTFGMKRKYIRIGGEDIELKDIKAQLAKLRKKHIKYVLECLKSSTAQIKNPENYILTALCRAPATIDAYYAAKKAAEKQQSGRDSPNSFNNFPQRDYEGYEDELEKSLLSNMLST